MTTSHSNLRGSDEEDMLLTCCCLLPLPDPAADRMVLVVAVVVAEVDVVREADDVSSPGATIVLASRLRRAVISRGRGQKRREGGMEKGREKRDAGGVDIINLSMVLGSYAFTPHLISKICPGGGRETREVRTAQVRCGLRWGDSRLPGLHL